ncbi:unnamed protein product [Onchocerca ochengi]|uniref:ULD domain-containing protein n=1 Tax=Onchocerca ochengi TaxID=42157 RepID=A0A182DYH1_ONCOC|nr:unnamed protein product [Onchocerca ochengi]
MFPVRVVVESVRPQHCLTCARDGHMLVDSYAIVSGATLLSQLVDTVLSALGMPQLAVNSKGSLSIFAFLTLTHKWFWQAYLVLSQLLRKSKLETTSPGSNSSRLRFVLANTNPLKRGQRPVIRRYLVDDVVVIIWARLLRYAFEEEEKVSEEGEEEEEEENDSYCRLIHFSR